MIALPIFEYLDNDNIDNIWRGENLVDTISWCLFALFDTKIESNSSRFIWILNFKKYSSPDVGFMVCFSRSVTAG